MHFFHLADLHLGRTLHKHSLIEDQKYYLDFVLEQAKIYEPDAIVIAGDIYDRTIPSAESTQLFDYFLSKLSRLDCCTMIIAGNHDSAIRLSYASGFFKEFNIHIVTEFQGRVDTVILEQDQAYNFHLVPFFKPIEIRKFFPEVKIETYQDALAAILNTIDYDAPGKHILVAHQFFINQKGEEIVSESEQIFVGGLDRIPAEMIKDFDYVALGHLHQPHQVEYVNIRYAGSPLVYSLSELARPKFLSLLEFDVERGLVLQKINFEPLHQVRLIEGKFDELIKQAAKNPSEDYIYLSITDQNHITDLAAGFRRFYPRLLEVRTPSFQNATGDFNVLGKAPNELSISQLFSLFHQEETGEEISATDQALIKELEEIGEN